MNVSDFDYELPGALVAQEPLPERDASRLLVLDRRTGALEHRHFRDLPDILDPKDLLVLNDTKVVPARLEGKKPTGGRVELFLLERADGSEDAPVWECLSHASNPLREGSRVNLGSGLAAEIVGRRGEHFLVRFEDEEGRATEKLEAHGRVPLPPYIRRDAGDPRNEHDRARYQTVFARHPGAVAAPTAGLHFTPGLIEAMERRGIEIAFVTLHTGIGTFAPVRVERVEDHRMESERYELTPQTAQAIARTRERGGRVVAVGTTVTRTLEASAEPGGLVRPGSGRSDLFIRPGHAFTVPNALVTNFHLPRSTLLMLVCAFAGREAVLAAYREAVRDGYRFFSYGDAMLLV